jgi:hypothetical protein
MGIESRDRFASQGSRPCAVFRIFAVGLYPVSASSDVVVSFVVGDRDEAILAVLAS